MLPFQRTIIAASLLFSPSVSWAQNSKFKAVSVGGVSIKNLDEGAANRRLKRELAPKLNFRVGLTLGTKIAFRKRSELGFSLDIDRLLNQAKSGSGNIPISFQVDRKRAAQALSRISKSLSSEARDARPILMDSQFSIRPEVIGRSLNFSQSAARLKVQAEADASKTRFELAEASHKPVLSRDRLKGIDGVIGTFTTRFNPGQVKRSTNMRVAIGMIDGTLLSANEIFSLNKTVGERTQARGFRTAIIFEDGKEKPGLGGGVSQVTGTLFNAALCACLPIVTYRTHSRPVVYLPIGRDATVAWGSFDMKFKNDTGHPVFISYQIKSSKATVTLFGHLSGKKASLRVTSQRNGVRNISAQLFRTIRQNGKVIQKKRVGTSHYLWKKDNED